jgi:hypothetical protein
MFPGPGAVSGEDELIHGQAQGVDSDPPRDPGKGGIGEDDAAVLNHINGFVRLFHQQPVDVFADLLRLLFLNSARDSGLTLKGRRHYCSHNSKVEGCCQLKRRLRWAMGDDGDVARKRELGYPAGHDE